MNPSRRTNNYRQIVWEQDTTEATNLFNITCKSKQKCHRLFMEKSFVAQTRGDFCGLASIASTLHYLNQLIGLNEAKNNFQNIRNQQYIYDNYIKGCLDVKYGISMIQLVQILHTIISDFNLPYCVSYVFISNYEKLTKLFENDIQFIHQSFEQKQEQKQSGNSFCEAVPFVIIGNYWRQIDKHRGGHWSPIINISSDIKSIFLADVSSHRIKPHWIKINDFIPAMFHRVKVTNLPRGYIRIFHNKIANFDPYHKLIINKNNNIYVRMATNLDVLTLSKIQVDAWKQTYRGIIDDTFLDSDSMTVKRKYKRWMEIFSNNYLISTNQKPSKKYTVYKYIIVICQYNKVLGYCTVGKPGRLSLKKTLSVLQSYNKNTIIDGELFTLYLSNECPKRKGFGGSLFDIAYDLIKYGFNWNLTVESNINGNNKQTKIDCKKIEKQCVVGLWLLGENQIAVKFYQKKGGIMINDNERAHFGGKIYRYSSMVFGFGALHE